MSTPLAWAFVSTLACRAAWLVDHWRRRPSRHGQRRPGRTELQTSPRRAHPRVSSASCGASRDNHMTTTSIARGLPSPQSCFLGSTSKEGRTQGRRGATIPTQHTTVPRSVALPYAAPSCAVPWHRCCCCMVAYLLILPHNKIFLTNEQDVVNK